MEENRYVNMWRYLDNDPWWYLVCDISILFFGYWTLLCHLTVFLEKNLFFLLGIWSISMVIICGIIFLYKRGHPASNKNSISPQISPNQKIQNVLFWIIVFSILVLTLISHRADIDDNRYINRAVTIADDPSDPILVFDHRHDIQDVPIKITSKLYSNSILAGALSKITGIPAIYFPHMVFSSFAAILSVMALARLLRKLAPDYWAFALLALFIFLISDGAVHRTYGNFSIVRLHQGKGILVSIVVPLIIVYALDFMERPGWKNWLLLFFAQIASIGVSSSALLVAPLTSLFSLITYGLYSGKFSFRRRLLPGIMASIYILIMVGGLYYYGQKQWPGRRAFIGVLPPPPKKHKLVKSDSPKLKKLNKNIYIWNTKLVFGNGRFAVFYAVIILTAWIWAPTRLARWFCIVFPIGVAAVFLLPYTSRLVPFNFYWRIFWVLPLPILAGLTLTAPLKNRRLSRRHSIYRFSIFFVILVITLFGISEKNILAKSNYVHIGLPGLKVDQGYEIAHYIDKILDDRPNVLAPYNICVWLPTFHHHPYPIITRYLADKMLGEEAQDRVALNRYIDGGRHMKISESVFREQLDRFHIRLVCFRKTHPRRAPIIKILTDLGYKKDTIINDYEIWVRQPA